MQPSPPQSSPEVDGPTSKPVGAMSARSLLRLPVADRARPRSHCSAVDLLASAPGQRLFKTAAEVDEYLQTERDAWDR